MKAVKNISVIFVKWSNFYEICFITMTSIQASIYKQLLWKHIYINKCNVFFLFLTFYNGPYTICTSHDHKYLDEFSPTSL